MKEKYGKFFKKYYILMIVYAVFGLISGYVSYSDSTFGDVVVWWAYLGSLITLGVVVLSVIAIFNFRKNKLSNITLIIPIYHIVLAVATFIYGIILGIGAIISGINPDNIVIPSWFTLSAIISSLFELVFSVYILNKFK